MFTSGSLIRTHFTVNGIDFCVDTAVILTHQNKFDFETMLFDCTGEHPWDSFDEMHASTFERAKQNHMQMVKRYTVPFKVTPSADDFSGIDRVIAELKRDVSA